MFFGILPLLRFMKLSFISCLHFQVIRFFMFDQELSCLKVLLIINICCPIIAWPDNDMTIKTKVSSAQKKGHKIKDFKCQIRLISQNVRMHSNNSNLHMIWAQYILSLVMIGLDKKQKNHLTMRCPPSHGPKKIFGQFT